MLLNLNIHLITSSYVDILYLYLHCPNTICRPYLCSFYPPRPQPNLPPAPPSPTSSLLFPSNTRLSEPSVDSTKIPTPHTSSLNQFARSPGSQFLLQPPIKVFPVATLAAQPASTSIKPPHRTQSPSITDSFIYTNTNFIYGISFSLCYFL